MIDLTPHFETPPVLESQRLLLRAPSLDDAADVFGYSQDAEVFRFIPYEPHQSIDDSRAFIQSMLDAAQARNRITWAAQSKQLGTVIGMTHALRIDTAHQQCEIGYAIAKPHWGSGIGFEAASLVLACCLNRFGFHRVAAVCDVGNAASARILQKLGMRHEGTHNDVQFRRGRWHSMHIYATINPA